MVKNYILQIQVIIVKFVMAEEKNDKALHFSPGLWISLFFTQ